MNSMTIQHWKNRKKRYSVSAKVHQSKATKQHGAHRDGNFQQLTSPDTPTSKPQDSTGLGARHGGSIHRVLEFARRCHLRKEIGHIWRDYPRRQETSRHQEAPG